jgi:single-stranded DNA-specific DHH superfamily exonuclease
MAASNQGIVTQLLEKYGFHDLAEMTEEESQSFYKLLKQAETKTLTLDDFKRYIRSLISAVERELVDTSEVETAFFGVLRRENRAHLYLKARLKNYLFLENFLIQPDLARKQLEEVVSRLGGKHDKI